MSKRCRTLNLNNYKVISTEGKTLEQLREEADLSVVLFKKGDETPATLYLVSKRPKKKPVNDTDNAIWKPNVHIATTGSSSQYIARVEWWFSSADDEYQNKLMLLFDNLDVYKEVAKAKRWLIEKCDIQNGVGQYPYRRSDINRFITGWLKRSSVRSEGYGR